MSKKTLIQILLLLFLIILSSYIFYQVPHNKNEKNQDTIKENQKGNISETKLSNNQNIIENIRYKSVNFKGDIFEILADYGETTLENLNQMKLFNVNSNIFFNDGETINLKSNFADFNTRTFETTFFNNVSIIKKNEIINGEKLYFVMESSVEDLDSGDEKEENLIRITGNVIYKKPGYIAKADIIEIDLLTKNLTIEMIDKKNKVTINASSK